MEKEKKKGAVTSEERNREANANPVEEALRKQWKAACTHARTHARMHARRQASTAWERGYEQRTGCWDWVKEREGATRKRGSSTSTERVARLNNSIATKFDRNKLFSTSIE